MSTIHEIIGLTPEEFDRLLREQGSVSGMLEPRMHRHPLLGITHAHGPTEEAARTSHTHHPKVEWDSTPVPVCWRCEWVAADCVCPEGPQTQRDQ